MATIAELIHYPVKGCAGTSVRTAELTPAGIAHDRVFMVVDDRGNFRSQRTAPRMALIRPGVDSDGGRLRLEHGSLDPLEIGTAPEGPRLDVALHGKPFTGVDQGDEAARWLSRALDAPSRLVRVPDDHDRRVDGMTPGTSAFADSTAVLMTSLSSLDLLNERILARGADTVPMNRFRPNIVVSGWPEPHTEDRVRALRLGTADMGYAKACVRCAVTTVDQARGARAGHEPLRTLAAYRRVNTGGVSFGAKFSVTGPGRISVGDELEVTAWDEPEERLTAALV